MQTYSFDLTIYLNTKVLPTDLMRTKKHKIYSGLMVSMKEGWNISLLAMHCYQGQITNQLLENQFVRLKGSMKA